MKRVLFWTGALLLPFLGMFVVLAFTEFGFRFVVSRFLPLLQPNVHIGEIHGVLAGPIEIKDFQLTTTVAILEADHLQLDWQPLSLLSGTVVVDYMEGQEVRVQLQKRSATESASSATKPPQRFSAAMVVEASSFSNVAIQPVKGDSTTLARIDFGAEFRNDELQVKKLQVAGPKIFAEGDGSVTIRAPYELSANVGWRVELSNSLQVAGYSIITGQPAEFRIVQSISEPISAQVSATIIDLAGSPRWEASLALTDLNTPGQIITGIESTMDLEANASGTLDSIVASGAIAVKEAPGHDVSVDLDFGVGANRIEINKLALRKDENQREAFVDGFVDWSTGAPSVQLHARLKDFGWPLLAPVATASGQIEASGNLSAYQISVDGSLNAADLPTTDIVFSASGDQNHILLDRLQATSVGGSVLNVEGEIGTATDVRWNVEIAELGELLPGSTGTLSSAGEVTGSVAHHNLSAKVHGSDYSLQLALSGGYADRSWLGQLSTFGADSRLAGIWELEKSPVMLKVSAEEISGSEFCVANMPRRLCVAGNWSRRNPWELQMQLRDFPLADAFGFVPANVVLDGEVNGLARASARPGGPWQAEGEFSLSSGAVRKKHGTNPTLWLSHKGGEFEFQVRDWVASSRFQLVTSDDGFVKGTLSVPLAANGLDRSAALQGSVLAQVNDVSPLSLLVPELAGLTGRASAEIDIQGSLNTPELLGEARFADGQLDIDEIGVKLENINISATAKTDHLVFSGRVNSGEGDAGFEGRLSLETFGGDLHIEGESFRVANLPGLSVDVSPTVDLTIAEREVHISGKVFVPAASIASVDVRQRVTVSPDQRIVGMATPIDDNDGWKVHTDVDVALGDVQIDSYGFKGKASGEISLRTEPGHPNSATGVLEAVNGEFGALGQNFEIDTGKLIYNDGPLNDPGLDIRALRTAPEVVVGVNIRGTLREPDIQLFSDPVMARPEILAYLTTGKSIDNLRHDSAAQASLGHAATELGAGLLANEVGAQLGLDDVGVTSGEEGADSSLELGKYVSPRLYVRYGIGLGEAIDAFMLRYSLSSKWTLEASSGEYESADLLYNIEN